jgi:hypothetical protein
MAFVFVVFAMIPASRGMMSVGVVDGSGWRLVFLSLGRGGVVVLVIFHTFIVSMPVSGMVVERVLIYFLFQPLHIAGFDFIKTSFKRVARKPFRATGHKQKLLSSPNLLFSFKSRAEGVELPTRPSAL